MADTCPMSELNVDNNTSKLKNDEKVQETAFSPPICDDEDEDLPNQACEPPIYEKVINYILCR